jgi:hypothetical protein
MLKAHFIKPSKMRSIKFIFKKKLFLFYVYAGWQESKIAVYECFNNEILYFTNNQLKLHSFNKK